MTKSRYSQFPRRSLLFMPGDSRPKISKATQLEVDAIIMDLEDGVALNHKTEARQTVVEALNTLAFGPRERLIRLNALPHLPAAAAAELALADLRGTAVARPDGYVIPKVEQPEQVQFVSNFLDETERTHGWPTGGIRLLVLIETALGVMNLRDIAQASPRLEALMFGAEDLAGDVGAIRTPAGWEVFYARSAVVTAAAAYGLQAIDSPCLDLNDLPALEQECRLARQLGYDGKMAIHPRHIEPINRIFAPSPEEIEQAQRLLQAHAAHQAAGTGVFAFEGKMVDMPLVRAAEHILARARAVGLLAREG